MRNLRLYPVVDVKKQSFTGHKVHTVPKQSLTLREIIQRYVRKMPIPVSSDQGIYQDRMGDLEKMQHDDLTIQAERARDVKRAISTAQLNEKNRLAAEQQAALEKLLAEKIKADMAKSAGGGGAGEGPPKLA